MIPLQRRQFAPSSPKEVGETSPEPEFNPTPEQSHILQLVNESSNNLLIDALAGAGKTSTLELIQAHVKPPVLCLAFNTRIAKEMQKRFLETTEVRTFNSLGHRIWQASCYNKLVLNENKTRDLFKSIISELDRDEQNACWEEWQEIRAAVGYAKSIGYIPDGMPYTKRRLAGAGELCAGLDGEISDLAKELVDSIICASIKTAHAGQIDYDDQIYMPTLFGGTFPVFPLVLVDEAQDLNACNHKMLTRFKHARIIAVGDPRQSIYAFRGAVTGGMGKLKETFKMTEAGLSVCFRCRSSIVQNVHWHAPHMRWTKEGGIVEHVDKPSPNLFPDNSAIICRNNAPLFALGIRLLMHGRSVSVTGSDIGPKILGIMKKFGDDSTPQRDVHQEINHWLDQKLSKGSKSAPDVADCMRVFADRGKTLGQAIALAEDLFRQEGTLTLLTGHKAKGLEWDVVYHLDPWLINEYKGEQELNLRYVIRTRARDEYYEMMSGDFDWGVS